MDRTPDLSKIENMLAGPEVGNKIKFSRVGIERMIQIRQDRATAISVYRFVWPAANLAVEFNGRL